MGVSSVPYTDRYLIIGFVKQIIVIVIIAYFEKYIMVQKVKLFDKFTFCSEEKSVQSG